MKNLRLEKFSLRAAPRTTNDHDEDRRPLLLVDQSLSLNLGHVYGIVGPNGCGKSSLLAALARREFPEFPKDESIVVKLVAQDDGDVDQFAASSEETVLNVALESTKPRRLSSDEGEDEDEEGETHAELTQRTEKTIEVLKGLGFNRPMREKPASRLSGGWKRKLSLAIALLAGADVLLLDEPNNGLDIKAMMYLERLIKEELSHEGNIVVVVSHDVEFLANVTTDVVAFRRREEDKSSLRQRTSSTTMEQFELIQFPGSYGAYEEHLERMRTTARSRVDGASKEREKAAAFIQTASRSNDPNKQRQAKERADKKMERIGNYRDDGKKYKTHSLKTLCEESLRLPQRVPDEFRDADNVKFRFKIASDEHALAADPDATIIKLEELDVKYASAPAAQLRKLNIPLTASGKICLVGNNGAGKSLLLGAIAKRLGVAADAAGLAAVPPVDIVQGKITCAYETKLRVGYLRQNHGELLDERFGAVRVVDFVVRRMKSRAGDDASHDAETTERDLEAARAHLGGFGLSGAVALRTISNLSGGQRLKLALCEIMLREPNVLICDEPTQHLDAEAIEAFSHAIREDFAGCALVSTHNRRLIKSFREFWFADEKRQTVRVFKAEGEDEVEEELARFFGTKSSA